jgi:glycerol transport system ATP-binding protein
MTVGQNLAFPLRNRGVSQGRIDARVREIAEMLEMEDRLGARAAGLTPDDKQKISMGRGLVREDVAVIMFDEPLTVIDPALKWKLRSKLKELHQRIAVTMIYVTHDQTEALTFADQVVVMQDGEVVQVGTPVDLFERPQHTFVGHFIGSPGMNVLPCEVRDGSAFFQGLPVELAGHIPPAVPGRTEIGIRPEYVRLAAHGIPATVRKAADIGRHTVVEALANDVAVSAIVDGPVPMEGETVHLDFERSQTRLYADGWLASEEAHP